LKQGRVLVVVTDPADARALPDGLAVTAEQYLAGGAGVADPSLFIVNLCRSVGYGTPGYYVSLLADARGQRVLPEIETSAGLAEPYARFRALQEAGVPTLDEAEMAVRRRSLDLPSVPVAAHGAGTAGAPFPVPVVRAPEPEGGAACRFAREDEFVETMVVLGECADARFRRAAREVFREWPAPLLRLQFVCDDDEWKVAQVAAASVAELSAAERALLRSALEGGRLGVAAADATRETVRASIAVIEDAADPFSPSSPETIDHLERVAARMNVHIARLGTGDLRRLPEYDACFIRCYTAVTHPAFQFQLRAEALDMPVIDDTQSTIRCTNKVYIEELLRRAGLPTPRALILTEQTPWPQIEALGMPFVLKLPDGSFSDAVHKVTNRAEYDALSPALYRRSPLLIAQEWLPTDFDWRVTVLGGRLLFAARYYMARGHWQIRSVEGGAERYGKVEAVARADAPPAITDLALRAAALIGSGFYGVDVKETPAGPVIIEVNDNPNLDRGYDDTADGDVIYEDLIRFFLERVEATGAARPAAEPATAGMAAAAPKRARSPYRPLRGRPSYRAFGVAGLEVEYPTVDAQTLDVRPLVEPAFRTLAGRGASDVELEHVAFSNEFADHVFEMKTTVPTPTLAESEVHLVDGLRRFTALLRDEFGGRLLPTGMHPWFDPRDGRLWTRSGLRIYATYAMIFDVRTHGWMNVQATHLNVPFGDEAETMAMHTAAALLLPYLPAVAASTPIHDGRLRDTEDARLAWLSTIQSRIPESVGAVVPEYVDGFADYRRRILAPMFEALDRLPHSAPLRRDFLNARGAALRFGRRALEIRVLDVQECVRMDVAIAVFARAALEHITRELRAGRLTPPPHERLVADYRACLRHGSRARVEAPHIDAPRERDGRVRAADAVRALIDAARRYVPEEDRGYLPLVEAVADHGTLAERIRARLHPFEAQAGGALRAAMRELYGELADCLERNEPWSGRGG
jgi:glutathione synthase/RimK-type ligase-like ATP-grasp enzyme/gamma-glutamyl:cysteine ligase YbdK (ATP-grasp superfamily)